MGGQVQRVLNAHLESRPLGRGVWRLTSGDGAGVEIIVRPSDPDAGATLARLRASRAVIVWDGAGATITLSTPAGPRLIRALTVILHEPRPALYEALQLPRFDAAAHRFWRRVFWLVRIPGGRRLLGLMARRTADRR